MIDVSVLILFFNRPEPLAQVFAAVREAQPARLFLYQDGPRNEQDLPGIEACREVVSKIDWDCEVHRNYQSINAGCDPSNFNAQRWAFSLTEKCIVFEDDSIPSVSFLRFCKEMLDKYEKDERIVMVTGFNTDEVSRDVEADYFFTSAFSIWGWASWARVVNNWDEQYSFLDNPEQMALLEESVRCRNFRKDMIPMCRAHRNSGKAYYETIFWAYMVLHSGLAIMPKKNMITNLGAVINASVHYAGNLKCMPRDLRRQFTMQRYELQFPLKHPTHVEENLAYIRRLYKRNAWGHPFIKLGHAMEELFLNLYYGNFSFIASSLKNRINIWLHGKQHY